MLSGAPLITEKQFELLLANAPTCVLSNHDPIPVVKIFLPHVRWLLAWIDPSDHDRVYGVMNSAIVNRRRPTSGCPTLSPLDSASSCGLSATGTSG